MAKLLQMNPQKHEIVLRPETVDKGGDFAEVYFKFGEAEGTNCFTAKEAQKIGQWFVALAKEIAPDA